MNLNVPSAKAEFTQSKDSGEENSQRTSAATAMLILFLIVLGLFGFVSPILWPKSNQPQMSGSNIRAALRRLGVDR